MASREPIQDRYYKGVRGFFKQNHVAVMPRAAAVCLHYLHEVSERESTSVTGEVDAVLWDARYIENHCRPLLEGLTIEQIEDGMSLLVVKNFVKLSKRWIAMVGFADHEVEANREKERVKRRNTRAKTKDSTPAMSQQKGTMSHIKGTESQKKKTESPLKEVTNVVSKEVETRDPEPPHTEEIDTKALDPRFDGPQLIPGSNAWRLNKAFPDYQPASCIKSVTQLLQYFGKLKNFDESLNAVISAFPPERGTHDGFDGLHGWLHMKLKFVLQDEAKNKTSLPASSATGLVEGFRS